MLELAARMWKPDLHQSFENMMNAAVDIAPVKAAPKDYFKDVAVLIEVG